MKTLLTLYILAIAVISSANSADILPHSPKEPAALEYKYFPSRLHAFVFRNWTSVQKERLAKVVGATPSQIDEIAAEMSLPAQGKIGDKWDTQSGYITVVRRNWHLLDYPQMLKLLNIDAKTFKYRLIEDDFLFIKMGSLKPVCGELKYEKSSPKILEKSRKFSKWLKDAGIGRLSEEKPRFAFYEDFGKAKDDSERGFWKNVAKFFQREKTTRFDENDDGSIKMATSYFSDYADPLMSDISYPDGLLKELSKRGINGIWIHVVLRSLVEPDGIFDGSADAQKRIENLRKLVARADKYGIKVWLYLNEPRPMPNEFFGSSPERMAVRGAQRRIVSALCSSKKGVLEWLSRSVEKVFSQVPDLGGAFSITASENLTNCLAHRYAEVPCPICRKRGAPAIISEINNTIGRAIKRASHDAKFIVWDWSWQPKDISPTISLLDKDSVFMTISERGLPIERGGVKNEVNEYSISSVGPSHEAIERWTVAKRCGHPVMAKVQVNTSWEFSVVPYLPLAELAAEHARNLHKIGAENALLSWSVGGFPSENMEVFNRYDQSVSIEENLRRTAEKNYGKNAVPQILKAWKIFAAAFREYPFNIGTLYTSPHHWGAANPVYTKKTNFRATMVGIPYDDIKRWRSIFPIEVYIGQMRKIGDGFGDGVKVLKAVNTRAMTSEQAKRLSDITDYSETAKIHFQSCANQAEYIVLRDSPNPDTKRMSEILAKESELAMKMLDIDLRNPYVGYESSNHYFYTAIDLFEKIASVRYAEEFLKNQTETDAK